MKISIEMTETELKDLLSKITVKKYNMPIKAITVNYDETIPKFNFELDDSKVATKSEA